MLLRDFSSQRMHPFRLKDFIKARLAYEIPRVKFHYLEREDSRKPQSILNFFS